MFYVFLLLFIFFERKQFQYGMKNINENLLSQNLSEMASFKYINQNGLSYPENGNKEPLQSQLFSDIEARRVRQQSFARKSSLTPLELSADTWDSKHLDKFLKSSEFAIKSHTINKQSLMLSSSTKKSDLKNSQFYFRTIVNNRNTSTIGYSKDNPLVSNVEINTHNLEKILLLTKADQNKESARFTKSIEFQSLRNRPTNPLTFKNIKEEEQRRSNFKKFRMLNLIQKRYPHGMIGVDNPERQNSKFYENELKPLRIRQEPNSHESYLIDAKWKSKRHLQPLQLQEKKQQQHINIRYFSNSPGYDYNIITNRSLVKQ